MNQHDKVGIVVIGLNEAANLELCLNSCLAQSDRLVYVDSGSTDGSRDIAAGLQVPVIQLSAACPKTAARGRNSGFDWLLEKHADLEYVQFVDGDCELLEGWLSSGIGYLEENSGVAIVYGGLGERYPSQSVYNLLADIEWSTPAGEVSTSGGIFLARVDAFRAVNGFRTDLAGGEEPEMCIRLQQAGWKLYKLERKMALHDADMHHFHQWWKRSTRDGYSFAEGMGMHGLTEYRHYLRETLSAIAWAGALPILILVLSIAVEPGFSYLLLIYPIQILRVSLKGQRDRISNLKWSFFLAVRKFPELLGVLRYCADRWFSGTRRAAG